jgi:hypothetical protein
LETNHVYAFGPHGVLDLSRKIPVPGLAVFGRMEGTGMVGRYGETFSEELAPTPDASLPLFAQTRVNKTAVPTTLGGEVGLSYTLPEWNHSRFLIGYQYEAFFDVARIAENGSRAHLNVQGLFLRAELNF